jgi:PAS domain S-box-containing protein
MKAMSAKSDKVNILLVDDQPGKLLTYEAILNSLDENLIKVSSGRDALEQLLKNDIAVILVDVCMPDLDGFQLASMIRDHPRFQKTAIIFISAILLSEMDSLRGYEMGAVDYVPVPVVPELLRAKVKVFSELYRKTRELEALNQQLELRVAERTAALERSTAKLRESEQRRSLALAAGQMGSWDWDATTDNFTWDDGQCHIFGIEPGRLPPTSASFYGFIHPDDLDGFRTEFQKMSEESSAQQFQFRIRHGDGAIRWCLMSAAATFGSDGRLARVSGVTFDITRQHENEQRQSLLAREVDHRAKNALAMVQAVVRMTRANDMNAYMRAVEGRIQALSQAHNLLADSRWQGARIRRLIEEELAPFDHEDRRRFSISGPDIILAPSIAQSLALTLHELTTNAAKYGALSTDGGSLNLSWLISSDGVLSIDWWEQGGPPTVSPQEKGFGTRILFAGVEQQLNGKAEMEWLQEGLRCKLTIPNASASAQEMSGIESRLVAQG